MWFGFYSSSVSRREIGRPPGHQAIEKYAHGRPISLDFIPALVISSLHPWVQGHKALMTISELKHPRMGVKLHSPGDARG